MWGMFVMAATGLMAWFKVLIGGRVPGWWIDVALTIHWYEAVLATLAIIVWHFYAVIFDPDAYPMNWAWFDGRCRSSTTSMNIRSIRCSLEGQRSESGEDAENAKRRAVESAK